MKIYNVSNGSGTAVNKDGLYLDIPYEDYASDIFPGVRFSDFAHGDKSNTKFTTPEMVFGTNAHNALLSKDNKINSAFEGLVDPYNRMLEGYLGAVMKYTKDEDIVSVDYEVTLVYEGFKCRIDLLITTPTGVHIFDLKTIKDIKNWYKNITKLQYAEQLAWYEYVYTKLTKKLVLTTYLGFLSTTTDEHRVVGLLPNTRERALVEAWRLHNVWSCNKLGVGVI